MKICITSQGKTLESKVDPRFGRCQYFIFVDTETGSYEAQENPYKDAGGAGIQVGQVMADKKVGAVLTGNVGPNAFQTLNAANIKVFTGISGTVKEVFDNYRNGKKSSAADGPSVEPHHGMNS